MEKKIKLDLKDRKILYQLDLNSRQSFSQIGKKVRLDKNVVNYRIKNLENRGIITGYFTEIDSYRLGYTLYRVFLRFQDLAIGKEEEIIKELAKKERIGWIASVEGNWDLIMIVWAKNIFEFQEFFNKEILGEYSNYIQEKSISTYVRVNNFRRAYLMNLKQDTTPTEVIGSEEHEKIDSIDYKILKFLTENPRISILDIAKRIRASAKMVSYRIKNLVKKEIIKGFRPMLDLNLLGYEYYKVHFILKNATEQRREELMKYAKHHPNIVCVNETIGGADFEPEIQVRNSKEFRKVIREIRNKFSNIIKNYEYLLYFKEHKTFVYLYPNKKGSL